MIFDNYNIEAKSCNTNDRLKHVYQRDREARQNSLHLYIAQYRYPSIDHSVFEELDPRNLFWFSSNFCSRYKIAHSIASKRGINVSEGLKHQKSQFLLST